MYLFMHLYMYIVAFIYSIIYAFIFDCAESLLLRMGYSLVAMPMLLIVVTSLNTEQGL